MTKDKKSSAPYHLPPEELRAVLDALRDETGHLTAESVVEAASAPNHPLHNDPGFLFGDQAAAAHQHRLNYARGLIRSVHYRRHDEAPRAARVPYYVKSPSRPADEQGYKRVEDIRPASEDALLVLRDEMARVHGCLRRALSLCQVLDPAGVSPDIAALLSSAGAVLARLEPALVMGAAARET